MCTPTIEPPRNDVHLGKELEVFQEEPEGKAETVKLIEAFPEPPIAPKLKIELCFMSGMSSRSQPPVHPTMDIAIVNCKEGEACTPSNSEIFGNEFGYEYLLPYRLLCNYHIHF